MFIEIHGRNKNTTYLVVVTYQPSSTESDKLLWLDSSDSLLSEVTTKGNGVIFLTGDTSIDLTGEQKESTKRYKNILYVFNLQQQVTMSTRKGDSLIDHICSNRQ